MHFVLVEITFFWVVTPWSLIGTDVSEAAAASFIRVEE
jgi:hypothetical protein